MKKEKRNNGRNGGVGNHRCIGNCTLPVHDSFITHEFITSRLARNRYQLGKRFRRKAIATVRKNTATIVAGIIHSGRRKINYYPFVHFFPCRKCIEFVLACRESLINIPQQLFVSNRISFNMSIYSRIT